MTTRPQALYGALAVRYDTGFSQEISDSIDSLTQREIQLLDIKELNDLAAEYRQRIRAMIKSCRDAAPGSTVKGVYASFEKIFIRRQIADLWTLYRAAQEDSRELTAAYIKALGVFHSTTSGTGASRH